MTAMFIGGAMVAGLFYLAGKEADNAVEVERQYKAGQYGQEIEHMKDRSLYLAFY